MIEYDGSKCQPHGQTRCALCQAMAAKGFKPAAPAPPPATITGGPPPDIEGLSSVRDRLPETVEEANTEYDKILAEVNALKADKGEKRESTLEEPTRPRQPNVRISPGQTMLLDPKQSFAALPTDDSHASKVMRAAAKYAEASKDYAIQLTEVEMIKQNLLKAETWLNAAIRSRIDTEEELKKLITEGAA
jgi:hypothetical protein